MGRIFEYIIDRWWATLLLVFSLAVCLSFLDERTGCHTKNGIGINMMNGQPSIIFMTDCDNKTKEPRP